MDYTAIIQPGNIDHDPLINDALNRIYADYSVNVSVKNKAKNLLKFGRCENIGTSLGTIWFTGQDDADETYVADDTNSIDSISSSSASDTEVVTIEGHTMASGDRTFVSQTATLNGQTKVTLSTALNRVTRCYHNGESSTDLVGEIYIYEDTTISSGKPTDTTKIHLTIDAGKNQSEKCATTLSSTDYWIITTFRCSVLKKTAAYADCQLEWRSVGGVFREIEDITASNVAAGIFQFNPYMIVPANADVRLRAVADSASTEVSGSIQGYLAN